MNKHGNANKHLYQLNKLIDEHNYRKADEHYEPLISYIDQMEQLEITSVPISVVELFKKAHEEEKAKRVQLEKDVKEFCELHKLHILMKEHDGIRRFELFDKLSKVGKD